MESAARRASFSGLGGIGGAMDWLVGVGREMSSGEVRRSGVWWEGGGLLVGCGGGCVEQGG